MRVEKIVEKYTPELTDSLGITDLECKVLIPLLTGGRLTAGAISTVTGESLTNVRKTLTRLEKKKLVTSIEGVVPLYVALPLSSGLGDSLLEASEKMRKASEKARNSVQKQVSSSDEVTKQALDSRRSIITALRSEFNDHESKMIELVQQQVELIGNIANSVLTGYTARVESLLAAVETDMETNLGEKLEDLQVELDSIQQGFEQSLSEIDTDFEKWLEENKSSFESGRTSFEKKAKSLLEKSIDSVQRALSLAEQALSSVLEETSERLKSEISVTSEEAHETMKMVSDHFDQTVTQLENELSKSYNNAHESLQEILANSHEMSSENAEIARTRIQQASDNIASLRQDVLEWKSEAGTYATNSSQSIATQLGQIAASDIAYLEDIRNALTGHLERVSTMMSEEHSDLKALASDFQNEFEEAMASGRADILALLQTQFDAETKRAEDARESLNSDLEELRGNVDLDITGQLTEVVNDVSGVLETESQEMKDVTDNMASRLHSSFNNIQSTAVSKNKAIVSGVKRASDQLESDIDGLLSESVNEIAGALSKRVEETKELFESLNTRLDERLARSVSALSSHVDRVQKNVDTTIDDQVGRIDRHGQELRDEFHVHLEDMTRQFINLTQSLEATFNGLVSSQTVEARDLISSAHLEFKNSVRDEMATLKEDSLKLQQEYASEIGLRVDEVASSVASLKHDLEEFRIEKRTGLSESLSSTISKIEGNLRTIQDSLKEMETGTVKQLSDTFVQMSREFDTSVASARENISNRLDGIKDGIHVSLDKSTAAVRNIADSFVSTQLDSRQRLLADTSKKLDGAMLRVSKSSGEHVEKYTAKISNREKNIIKARRTVSDLVNDIIDNRRNDATEAFDAATSWIDSSMNSIGSTLEALGDKLDSEMSAAEQDLANDSQEISAGISERTENNIQRIEEISTAMFQRVENSINARLSGFQKTSASKLQKGVDSMGTLVNKLTTIIDAATEDSQLELSKQEETILASMKEEIQAYDAEVSNILSEHTTLMEKTCKQLTRRREDTHSKARDALVQANLTASRKFESKGLDLKTHMSSNSYELIEDLRSDSAAKITEVNDSITKLSSVTSADMAKLKESRNEILSQFEGDLERATKDWQKNMRTVSKSILDTLLESIGESSELTERTMKMLRAINEAETEILSEVPARSWYVSGSEEICGHIMDMAERSEKSITISVVDVGCLDLKKLSKVKTPHRRVLIIPASEELPIELEELEGWRIWKVRTPVLLSIRDEQEMLLGSAFKDETPIALVTLEEAYFQLYREVIGPRLVKNRVRES